MKKPKILALGISLSIVTSFLTYLTLSNASIEKPELLKRKPASHAVSYDMATIPINCKEEQVQKTSAVQVQITGGSCLSGRKMLFKVQNLNNKSEATVFKTKNAGFITDYLPLEKGENIIQIDQLLNGRRLSRKLIIHKQ